MTRHPRTNQLIGAVVGFSTLLAATLGVTTAYAQSPPVDVLAHPPQEKIELAGELNLQRLIDLVSERLDLDFQYDPSVLQGPPTTLRFGKGVTNAELWNLTNQVLAGRGLTTVIAQSCAQASILNEDGEPDAVDPAPNANREGEGEGHGDEEGSSQATARDRSILTIVKLTDAASFARVEHVALSPRVAGFATVLIPIRHRPVKEVVEGMKLLLSKPGGVIQEVSGQNAVLVSDLSTRLEALIPSIQALDDPGRMTALDRIDACHQSATTLVGVVTAAATSSATFANRAIQGKLTATQDDASMVLVAPKDDIARWRELIEQFDRPSAAVTRSYAPASFSLADVSRLIEETVRTKGPRGSGDQWRVVVDDLSGMLIVTATPAEHDQVASLIERLNALPAEAKRPVRVFPIRNRSITEIVEVLNNLLQVGVLDGAEFTTALDRTATGPSRDPDDSLQRSLPGSPSESGFSAQTTLPSVAGAPTSSLPRASPTLNTAHDSAGGQSRTRAPATIVLTADEGTNTLIAVGEPRKLAQLEELLRTIDVRQPQVMIEVLVVSLNEGDTLDLGVELEKIEISGDTVITLSSLFGLGPAAGAAAGKGFSGLILNPGDFRILIRALQTLNNGRSLNMPRVLVNNNQQANLDAVVQQPFVSTNASDTVATTSFGGFENAGTTISIKPQIAKGDHLVLEYSVSLSAFVGESSDPGIPPPRQQNNLQSIVTIPDGYTVVVGGIEISTQADATSQVPLIGDIPWIGEAFKSRSRSKSVSRFFIFIRPTILRNEGFEDLKYLSGVATRAAAVSDGFPEVEPRIIR